MKGLIVTREHKLELVDDIPMPVPGDYDALVKVECTLICNGTDNEIINGTLKEITEYPVMLGHESAGFVVSVGKKVRHYKQGDLVSRTIVRKNDQYATGWGAFSQYGLVTDYTAMVEDGCPEADRYTVGLMQGVYPRGIRPLEAAVMITLKEVYSVFMRIGLRESDKILIVGDGPVGLSMVMLSKMLGVEEIYLSGQNPLTMEIIRKSGATRVFDDLSDADRIEMEAVCGRRITQYMDAVGYPQTTLQGLKYLAAGGMINVYGLRSGSELKLPLDGMLRNWGIRFMQFPIHAIEGAAHQPICDAMLAGKLHPLSMITHQMPVEEYRHGFDLIRRREAVKVALLFR